MNVLHSNTEIQVLTMYKKKPLSGDSDFCGFSVIRNQCTQQNPTSPVLVTTYHFLCQLKASNLSTLAIVLTTDTSGQKAYE